MESINVMIDDSANLSVSTPKEEEISMSPLVSKEVTNISSEMSPDEITKNQIVNTESRIEDVEINRKQHSSRIHKNHPSSNIIGDLEEGVLTRKKDKVNYLEMINNVCFTSLVEPKKCQRSS